MPQPRNPRQGFALLATLALLLAILIFPATAAIGAVAKGAGSLHCDHPGPDRNPGRAITRVKAGIVEIVEKATYKPFGEQSEVITATALPAAAETKGWIGERFDADAGLQYLNARYYDPFLGMFLQPDWFEVTKAGVGTNRYSYSFNDPINKIDPNGNRTLSDAIQSFFAGFFGGTPKSAGTISDSQSERQARKLAQAVGTEIAKMPGAAAKQAVDGYRSVRKNTLSGSIVLPDVEAAMGGDVAAMIDVTPVGKGVGYVKDALKAFRIVCSFEGSTLVLAENGAKPIRAILPGRDRVWGLDANGDGNWHNVLGQTVSTYDHKVMVTIRDVETGAEQTITSNRIHPYFAQVPNATVVPPASEGFVYDGPLANGHWIDAGNLKAGYRLLNPDGSWAEVILVTEQPATLDAWNLTVENAQSYFVAEREGAEPVWVHNGPCTPNKLNHIFGNPKHQLDKVLAKYDGDPAKAYEAVSEKANKMLNDPQTSAAIRGMADRNGVLPSAGPIVDLGGGLVVQLSGGRINNGVIDIVSFSTIIRLP